MSSGTQSDNPGDTMRLAVERFRIKMESANRQFIQDRVDEIEAMHEACCTYLPSTLASTFYAIDVPAQLAVMCCAEFSECLISRS
ncbi:uncharacterized protein N7518_003653 [Penicillium psychrosexuale]|uniref:uncharacterized protein n=1 Tax=Penicillium psychrosexuale TaxID=1002107 RepID=UPI002544E903|nr:uncharacterized protein N7518_003653 [Penicillium psychrosexuale]KAJ5801585.1 hypothetical protein N7518_003653 [Penicillium psychrosexuale]